MYLKILENLMGLIFLCIYHFCSYNRDLVSLFRFPLRSHVQITSRAISFIYCLKYPYSFFFFFRAHKTEYMCYNQTGDISTLDGTPLKLVDKFTFLGSSVASTEKDIDTRLTKAWTAMNRLSIIWKSDLTDKMKRNFF